MPARLRPFFEDISLLFDDRESYHCVRIPETGTDHPLHDRGASVPSSIRKIADASRLSELVTKTDDFERAIALDD